MAFRSHWLLQRSGVDRQFSQTLAGCRKDRIGHCRNDGRSPGLAHSTRRLRTLDDMDFDYGRLIHAQDLIGVEISLLDTSVFDGDRAIERGGDAEHDRALDLRPDGIWINNGAAIDRAND